MPEMYFEGLWPISFVGSVGVVLFLTHITIVAVTIFLHRHQSHNALSLHPTISHFFRFWLWLTTGMITREWVAVHRKHHAMCETDDDPHSPVKKGILKVLFAGAWLYRQETTNLETLEQYGQGTPDDWLERNVYSRHPAFGVILMALIDILFFGLTGAAIFLVQMIWIPFWAAGVINGIGHFWGYRSFETEDASTNIVPWGLLIGGEELHNNHHAFASSARLSRYWWEIDLGWFYIRLMAFFRLARIRRVAPRFSSAGDRRTVRMDTVRAVVRNRFRILKLYSRWVILPVLREAHVNASKETRQLLRRARRLLLREYGPGGEAAQRTIQTVLNQFRELETVYRFKQGLKEIWLKNHNGRVQQLQGWCNEAEQTGIRVLQEFAEYLRGYGFRTI